LIPKRAIGGLVTTVFALALLLSFKTPAGPELAAGTTADAAIVGSPSPTPAATADDPVGTAPAQSNATPQPTAAAPASVYVDGTVAGSLVSTRYGDVQVEVVIQGGVVTDVVPLALPSGDRRSSRISEVAAPILRDETLAAQDADIDLLSGATYTSRAYARSLQSALDRARA